MIIFQIATWFYAFTQMYGYLGVFILSFFASIVIFISSPYLLIVFWLSAPSFGLNPTILALVSALGATLGKTLIYYVGFGSRKLLGEERRKKLEFAKLIMDKYGEPAVFLFAALPLPDDVLYIPLGMIGYSILKFCVFCFLGKLVLALAITWGGYFSIRVLGDFSGAFNGNGVGSLVVAAITLIFIIGSIYATLKIDWEKIFVKYMPKRMKVLEKIEEKKVANDS